MKQMQLAAIAVLLMSFAAALSIDTEVEAHRPAVVHHSAPIEAHLEVSEFQLVVTPVPAQHVQRQATSHSRRSQTISERSQSSSVLPASVQRCENRSGSYTAENPRSSASGRYQIIDSTFQSTQASKECRCSHASHATPAQQDRAAAELLSQKNGLQRHWKSCL